MLQFIRNKLVDAWVLSTKRQRIEAGGVLLGTTALIAMYVFVPALAIIIIGILYCGLMVGVWVKHDSDQADYHKYDLEWAYYRGSHPDWMIYSGATQRFPSFEEWRKQRKPAA